MPLLILLVVLIIAMLALTAMSVRVVKQYERGVVYRFGRVLQGPLRPGLALLAPGGKQLMIERFGRHGRVRILPGDDRVNYKPCVDITFGSLAKTFPGKTLGIILTGMGADGREGCRMMKKSGSVVWAQDEKTSVIYGMPMAVARDGLADEILSLDSVAPRLIQGVRG